MSHTSELIDRLKVLKGIESDYAVAEDLGITRAAISSYRRGLSHADDRIAVLLADAIGVDRLKTIARINADRAKKAEDRAFWKRIATAAGVVLAVYTSMPNAAVLASQNLHKETVVDIAHHSRGWHASC
jgi:predicted transcriptional regulator